MISNEESKEFLAQYIDINKEYSRNIFFELEEFKNKEAYLKNYEEILSVLEKIQNKINLQIFEYLINSIYEELSKFDPENIEYNIYKIQNMVISLQESEKELMDISNNINVLKKIWEGFVNRYPEIKNIQENFFLN
jgi:sulfite reductase alpha subunit-like flavoprotein